MIVAMKRGLRPEAPSTSAWKAQQPAGDDVWPHTKRVMPWSVAAIIVMICLVPFDAIKLNISFPFDLSVDRLVLFPVGLLWIASGLGAGKHAPRLPRLGVVGLAVLGWLAVCLLSIAVNAPRLIAAHELSLAGKRFLVLVTYVLFFAVVVTSVRRREAHNFITFWLGLSCVTAVGVIYQYRGASNPFFDAWGKLLPSQFSIAPAPARQFFYERVVNTGPTLQGLAAATMLTLPLAFTAQRFLAAEGRRERATYIVMSALLLAGALSTGKRSAAVIPIVALLVLVLYRPKLLVRYSPLAAVILVLIAVAAPGSLGSLRSQFGSGGTKSQESTQGRLADYGAVRPDIEKHLLFGRGYGSFDHTKYRLLDNQWLGTLIETGLAGLLALVGVVAAGWYAAHRLARRASAERGPPPIAAAAAMICFATSFALYDVLAFPQSVYLFFFIVALTVVTGEVKDQSVAQNPEAALASGGGSVRTWAFAGVVAGAALTALVTFGAGRTGSMRNAATFEQGEAETELFVSTSPRVTLAKYTRLSSTRPRSQLVSAVSATNASARSIAAAARIQPSELAVVSAPARFEQTAFAAAREEGRDRRSVSIAKTELPYGVDFQLVYGTPVIRVLTRAPDRRAAARLAQAASRGLQTAVAEELPGQDPRILVSREGTVRSRSYGLPARWPVGAVSGLAMFCLFLTGGVVARRRG